MAIDLPPAIPPQLTQLNRIEQYVAGSSPYVGIVNGYEVRVSGDHHLNDEELAKIFAAAKTPSQAIILMNAMTIRKGHLLVSMQYAPDVNVVHVHAIQGSVTNVQGEGIAEYFTGLEGDDDLTRADYERARVMANVRSERAGVNYSARFDVDPENPANVALIFNPEPVEDHDATDVILKLGNEGSRFVGRYFGDAALSHNFKNGTNAAVAYQTAFTDLGESRGGEDYHRVQLSMDRPFASGLYGISASHVEYSQDLGSFALATGGSGGGLTNVPVLGELDEVLGGLLSSLLGGGGGGAAIQQVDLEADINAIVLSGEQVLAGDLDYRFNLFQSIEYIDSQIEVDTLDPIQDEKYGVVEVGVKYFGAKALNESLLRWSGQFSVKAGVTGDSGTLGTYDEFVANSTTTPVPEVAPAARTAEFILLKPKLAMKLPLTASSSINANFSAQFADEQVPQQQQWVLGGMSSISAYLPGVLVGDSGYHGLVNYEYSFPLNFAKITTSAFAEYGAAWYENVSGDLGDERSIADAGVRMRAEFDYDFTLDAVAARKIADDGFNDSDDLDRLEADFYITLKKVF
jgi:hypothetical protein